MLIFGKAAGNARKSVFAKTVSTDAGRLEQSKYTLRMARLQFTHFIYDFMVKESTLVNNYQKIISVLKYVVAVLFLSAQYICKYLKA